MIQKTLRIGKEEITFKSSASIPRLYRVKLNRDIFADIKILKQAYETRANLGVEELEIFENIAFVMARHANPTMTDNIEEWLDKFEMFTLYEIIPEIIEMF